MSGMYRRSRAHQLLLQLLPPRCDVKEHLFTNGPAMESSNRKFCAVTISWWLLTDINVSESSAVTKTRPAAARRYHFHLVLTHAQAQCCIYSHEYTKLVFFKQLPRKTQLTKDGQSPYSISLEVRKLLSSCSSGTRGRICLWRSKELAIHIDFSFSGNHHHFPKRI